MDHDNEVTGSIIEARKFFLSQRVDDDTRQERYSLEEEFEKSARKRPKIVPLILFAVLVGAGLIGWGTMVLLDAFQPVNPAVVDNFQELRLREILSTARRNEQAVANQERELDALLSERDAAIDQTRADARAAIALLGQRLIPAAERNRRRARIQREERQEIERIQNDYAQRITEMEAGLERARSELTAYQARLTEQDRREQNLIASSEAVAQRQSSSLQTSFEDRLRALESRSRETIEAERAFHQEYVKLSEERHADEIRRLILLYNPIIEGDEAAEVLALDLPEPAGERPAYPGMLTEEGLWTETGYNEVWEGVKRMETLWSRMGRIPYENSVPTLLNQWRRQHRATFADLENVWSRMAVRIALQNRIIAELQGDVDFMEGVLTALADSGGDLGFVAEVENPQRLRLWFTTGTEPRAWARAEVVSAGVVVAEVEIFQEGDFWWARTISLVQAARPVRTLDRIRTRR